MASCSRERIIIPKESQCQDNTDYLFQDNYISPGVQLGSASFAPDGSSLASSRSTTAGLLLRNAHGQQRMTVANHGFLDSTEVYHPALNGTRIGEVVERWLALDTGLVKLDPSINFRNDDYFEASSPKRLMRSDELQLGEWFSCDGMSTGLVFLQYEGSRLMSPPRPADVRIEFSEFIEESILYSFGPSGAAVSDGLCGAPFLQDDSELRGVAGFFHRVSDHYCFAAVLDDVIAAGWSLA
ncbi:MAG: hypothetical protein M1829_002790 [Trizodia sp. TS-e1964]|nr:MAG: hypothetical protein M1829_002790 [Trizodia sp. TS-e1964]